MKVGPLSKGPAQPQRKRTRTVISTANIPSRESKRGRGMTIFDLPGELRNEIYRLALQLDREHVPVPPPPIPIPGLIPLPEDPDLDSVQNHFLVRGTRLIVRRSNLTAQVEDHNINSNDAASKKKAEPLNLNSNFALFLTSTQVFFEARGLMANETRAYIPICENIRYASSQGVSEDTITLALQEFMKVHFHLQAFTSDKAYDITEYISKLHEVLKEYMQYSQPVSKKHEWRRRHAIVHLDRFPSLWCSNLCPWAQGIRPLCIFYDLVKLIASDINTFWEIRFYVLTEGSSLSDELDLAELRACCREFGFDNVTVKAELSGKGKWSLEDREGQAKYITRDLSASSELWPHYHSPSKDVYGNFVYG